MQNYQDVSERLRWLRLEVTKTVTCCYVSIGLFCLYDSWWNLFFYHSVTGLDLWGVLVATGAVCIVYCTLVGTTCIKMSCVIMQVWLYLKLLNHQQAGSLFYILVSSNYLKLYNCVVWSAQRQIICMRVFTLIVHIWTKQLSRHWKDLIIWPWHGCCFRAVWKQ